MPTCWSQSICDDCDEIGHTWRKSCGLTCLDIFQASFKYAIQLYGAVYGASAVISGRRKEYYKQRFLKEILQSTVFLSCNAGFFCIAFCLVRKLLGKFYLLSCGFLPGFLSSFCAILVERKSRRGVLAVYMLNQGFDTLFNILKNSGYAKDVKYGEVVIFAIAMAALMYMYSNGSMPDGFIKTMFRKCFKGNTEKSEDPSDVHSDRQRDAKKSNSAIIKHSVLLGGKVFLVGTSIQMTYAVLTSMPNLLKKPGLILASLRKSYNFRFGAWLGSYVGLYEMLVKMLEKYYEAGGHLNAAFAGGAAGISMMFLRSSTYALYIASKALELSVMIGVEKEIFPYVKHFDSIVYAICTGIMFHAAVLQPYCLRSTYWNFLQRITGYKFHTMDRDKLDVFGYEKILDTVTQPKR